MIQWARIQLSRNRQDGTRTGHVLLRFACVSLVVFYKVETKFETNVTICFPFICHYDSSLLGL